MPKSTTSYQQASYSNKVTCSPTDDAACNDELSRRFASYCFTSNHGSIVFATKTVTIMIILHFLQVVLNILPTMTTHHIQHNIDSTTVQHFPHLRIITIILDHQK